MAHRKADYGLIISLYQKGLTVSGLSRQSDISEKRIYYVLKESDIALRPRSGIGKVLSPAQEEDIRDRLGTTG